MGRITDEARETISQIIADRSFPQSLKDRMLVELQLPTTKEVALRAAVVTAFDPVALLAARSAAIKVIVDSFKESI